MPNPTQNFWRQHEIALLAEAVRRSRAAGRKRLANGEAARIAAKLGRTVGAVQTKIRGLVLVLGTPRPYKRRSWTNEAKWTPTPEDIAASCREIRLAQGMPLEVDLT